jgi:hypothetical protein
MVLYQRGTSWGQFSAVTPIPTRPSHLAVYGRHHRLVQTIPLETSRLAHSASFVSPLQSLPSYHPQRVGGHAARWPSRWLTHSSRYGLDHPLGAAQELGKLGDRRAIAPLERCLHAGDSLLRVSAAKSLGAIGDPSATEALHSMAVEDDDRMVRSQAAAELFRLGDQRGFVLLSELLREPEIRSPQHFCKWMARLAVDQRAAEAMPHLREAKHGAGPLARWRIARAIRQLERLDSDDA